MDYVTEREEALPSLEVGEDGYSTTTMTLALGNVSTNESAEEWDFIPFSERPETYIVPVLFAIIFLIGVFGNGTLIVLFVKHRAMRNVPNMYIVSLAVGDLLVILFCVPFTSTLYTLESWPYGSVVCKFSEFIKDLSIGVSVFTLTALSADRYFAIVDPMRKLTGRRATRLTLVIIVGIWVLSVLIALPSALFSYTRVIDNDPSHTFEVCYPFPPELGERYPQVIVMLKFLVYYALPLFFIATFYIVMARHLVLSTQNMPGEAQGQTKQIQARKKVAKMVLSFVVIFAICFFPTHVFLLWFYFNPDGEYSYNEFWHVTRIVGFCLGFINSCINPITLYCVSGTFRKHFNDHLFCCLCPDTTRHNGYMLGGSDRRSKLASVSTKTKLTRAPAMEQRHLICSLNRNGTRGTTSTTMTTCLLKDDESGSPQFPLVGCSKRMTGAGQTKSLNWVTMRKASEESPLAEEYTTTSFMKGHNGNSEVC